MSLNWQYSHTNSFLFGKIQEIPSFNQILIFDLDGTLIKTKSNRVFPINNDDWEIIHPNVITILKSLSQTLIIIISNQSGLTNDLKINDWKVKIENISKIIPFHIVFASISHNEFRKPFDGSWKFIKKYLSNNLSGNAIVDNNLSGNATVTNNLSGNSIVTNNLSDNAIVTNNFSGNAIITNNLSDNAIVDNNLSDNKIVDNNLSNNKIVDNNLSNKKIVDNNLFENKIAINNFDNVIFVGDAFGRIYQNSKKNDFSDSDLKFALNCGFRYATPEKYFNFNYVKVDYIITVPIITYYTTIEFNNIIKQIASQIESSDGNIYITMMGYPASGKSYLTNYIVKKYDIAINYGVSKSYDICVLNNDTKRKTITQNKFIINDNTNLNQTAINENNNYAKNNNLTHLVIKFDYNKHILKYLNSHRTYHYGKYISDITYNSLRKRNDVENLFGSVIVIGKIFPEIVKTLNYY